MERNNKFYKDRFSQLKTLLIELQNTFLMRAEVRTFGKVPELLWDDGFDYKNHGNESGDLRVWYVGRKCHCEFNTQNCNAEGWNTPCDKIDLEEYKNILFMIWNYHTGYPLEKGCAGPATWLIVDSADANWLEHISQQIEKLLAPLRTGKEWFFTTSAISRAVRPEEPQWMPGVVEWHYLKIIDEGIKACNDALMAIETDSLILTSLETKDNEKQFNGMPPLTATEINILEALGRNTLIGEELAKKAGYPYNSNFKGTLSSLRKRGILGNKSPGYFLEPKYYGLLKKSD